MGKNKWRENKQRETCAPPAPRPAAGASRWRIWRVWCLRCGEFLYGGVSRRLITFLRNELTRLVLLLGGRMGSRLATRVLRTTLKTAPQTTTKPKTPPMRKLPQTQTKAHTSSSPPALTPSLSATSRPSAFRPFFRMKKGRRGSGLSWGIRAMLFLPHHLLCLHLHLPNTLSPTM
jgi:hypothetical protein